MIISFGPVQIATYRDVHGRFDCWWFRLFGWGLHGTDDRVPVVLFSDRLNAHFFRMWGWRVKVLRRGRFG